MEKRPASQASDESRLVKDVVKAREMADASDDLRSLATEEKRKTVTLDGLANIEEELAGIRYEAKKEALDLSEEGLQIVIDVIKAKLRDLNGGVFEKLRNVSFTTTEEDRLYARLVMFEEELDRRQKPK